MKSEIVQEELLRIAAKNGGIVKPEVVVHEAADEDSPLHECFTWDDTEAAHQYRIWQARQLIRVVVHMIPQSTTPQRVFVSLSPDRNDDGGGYRVMATVLSDEDRRKQLLADALDELRVFEEKYKCLKELAHVFAAAHKAHRRLKTG